MDLSVVLTRDKANFAHVAAYAGNQEIINYVLDKDLASMLVMQNEDGSTPAHLACAAGHLQILRKICEARPDVLKIADHDGWTLAHVASYYGRLPILQFLAQRCRQLLYTPDLQGLLPVDVSTEQSCQLFFKLWAGLDMDFESDDFESDEDSVSDPESPILMRPHTENGFEEPTSKESSVKPRNFIGGPGQRLSDPIAEENQLSNRESKVFMRKDIATRGSNESQQLQIDHRLTVRDADLMQHTALPAGGLAQNTLETFIQTPRELHPDTVEVIHDQSLPTPSSGWQQDTATKDQESRWKSLLGSLKKGTDITSVLIPAEFLRPESSLERLQDMMQHGRLLEDVASCSDALERLIAVTRFHVSGIIKAVFDGKKPYNPVLGETCAWIFDHGSGLAGRTALVCEQVSHHPPISSFCLWNHNLGVQLSGSAEICPSFLGNSVDVPFKGERKLSLSSRLKSTAIFVHPQIHYYSAFCSGEEYIMTYPNLQYRGLFVGTRGAEWVGQVSIRCSKTDLVCKLQFKPLGWLGLWGSWHYVEGHIKRCTPSKSKKELIYKVAGHWDRIIHLIDQHTGEKSVLYDFDAADKTKKPSILQTHLSALPSDSQIVWKKLSEALRSGNMKQANMEKSAIEQEQRRLRQDRASKGQQWEPTFFRLEGKQWVPRIDKLTKALAC